MKLLREGMVALVIAACLGASPGLALVFEDVTEVAGVAMLHYRDPIAGSGDMGAGVVWFDFDGDGDFDIFAAQSGNETGIGGGCNRLFENLGAGAFAGVPLAAGLEACGDITWGAASADYDRDGDKDLFLSNDGQNRLMQNRLVEDGVATFVEVTNAAGLGPDPGARNASASWGDLDNDGFPDLYVSGYVAESFFDLPSDQRPNPPVVCWDSDLWHNNGDGTFTNIAAGAGLAGNGCGLASLWTDFDEDADLDLFVCNDYGAWHTPNRVYRNDGADASGVLPWMFTEVSAQVGLDYAIFCSGIGVADVNRDGHKDYYFSNTGQNKLAVNNGDGTFTERSLDLGVDVVSMFSEFSEVDGLPLAECLNTLGGDAGMRSLNASFGNAFMDLNNSTDQDLYIAQGYSQRAPDVVCGSPINPQANLLFGNEFNAGGNPPGFNELGASNNVDDPGNGRGMAMADYDQDGFVDIYVGNVGGVGGLTTPAQNVLLHNEGNGNNWLAVVPKGTIGNKEAIGTQITLMSRVLDVVYQYREIFGGGALLPQHANEAYFGLDFRNGVEKVIVRFLGVPDYELRNIPVNSRVEVLEPTATVVVSGNAPVYERGDLVRLGVDTMNRTAERLATELWVVHVGPDGTQAPYKRVPVNLGPGKSGHRELRVFLDLSFRPGINTLIFRLGPSTSDFVHQWYVDFEVVGLGPGPGGAPGSNGHGNPGQGTGTAGN